LRYGFGVSFRLAVIVLLAVGALILPARATPGAPASSSSAAAPPASPAPEKAYVAFFLGQGGYLFSWGIPYLAWQARELGMEADVFRYTEVKTAWKQISRKKADGYKVALVGYSLGNTTSTYLQRHLDVDLLIAIAESSLGRNHHIKKQNTKRSVLWYGPDFLSNAGLKHGFDEINYADTIHLFMDVDSRVVSSVLGELKTMAQPDKKDAPAPEPDGSTLAAELIVPPPAAAVRSTGDEIAEALAPPQGRGGNWLPPGELAGRDVTCTQCWGFQGRWETRLIALSMR
jgi:hypothetical protein